MRWADALNIGEGEAEAWQALDVINPNASPPVTSVLVLAARVRELDARERALIGEIALLDNLETRRLHEALERVEELETQLAEASYHAETVRLIENEHCGSVSIHPGEDILVMAHKLTSRDKVTYVRARLHTLGEAVRDCVRQIEEGSGA
jgi:hypothetical protein